MATKQKMLLSTASTSLSSSSDSDNSTSASSSVPSSWTTQKHKAQHEQAELASNQRSYTVHRRYYKAQNEEINTARTTPRRRHFEQSLDVYLPTTLSKGMPLVILVVGSAWAGHRAFLYRGCSFFNSIGPASIAQTVGATCICIRHSGGFPIISIPICCSIGIVLVALFKAGMPEEDLWSLSTQIFAVVAFLHLLLRLGARRSAMFPDMVQDVADALQYIHDIRTNQDHPDTTLRQALSKPSSVVFGGYSSGGHVAASVLQRPKLWAERDLTTDWIDGVVFLSGVLAVSSQQHPTWLTNFVTHSVFRERIQELPSPVEETAHLPSTNKKKKLPHLILQCRKELPLGLNWLDAFFAGREYHDRLKERNIPSKYIELERQNHWSILGSRALSNILKEELPELVKKER